MNDKKIVLAGNPNVGKSTIFNTLTHSKQHTGNWAGKTVDNKVGVMSYLKRNYYIYDLPGTYSLLPHSEEERIARDFLLFEEYDFIVVVCDASNLLRNLNLVLQLKEIDKELILCLNLMDEAKKKNIEIDILKLEKVLGIKVVDVCAHEKKSIDKLKNILINYISIKDSNDNSNNNSNNIIVYPKVIEDSINLISSYLDKYNISLNSRWLALNIIRDDKIIIDRVNEILGLDILLELEEVLNLVKIKLLEEDIIISDVDDVIVGVINDKASEVYNDVVRVKKEYSKDCFLDKIFTSKIFGIPIMLLFLAIVFLLTIKISNYPSSWLFSLFSYLEGILLECLLNLNVPSVLIDLLINGIYKVTTWVISVMLPPMMIFFPLFTLLEDFGYLPRMAFNLDGMFRKCSSCGKQSLTMAMGFGCNCVGITGTRIIDSKRERLIAILTNSFIPCNGKFPTIIAIITMFFVGLGNSFRDLFLSTFILLLVVLFGIFMTFLVSKVLSMTILSGYPSSFILELPSYRRPRIVKTFVTSIFDRTLFVLFRAIVVAIPSGFLIWLLANIDINGISILNHLVSFFEPFGSIFGLDGEIIIAFILGFPANEIIMPILLMCYLNTGMLVEYNSLIELKSLLIDNGWTILTAISVIILFVLHYPCSTACLTIKKETDSWLYVFLSMIIPTFLGLLFCFLLNLLFGSLI